MDAGLVTALSGALAQSKRLETVTNNLANADTVAYKSSDVVFEEVLQENLRPDGRSGIPEEAAKESQLLSQAGTESRAVLYGTEFTNLKGGSIRHTGRSLDIAIEGNGFLEVLTPNGIRLTRAGNLTLDAGGRLTTGDGFLVLGAGDANQDPGLRSLTVGAGRVSIDAEGNVYARNPGGGEDGDQLVGRLSLQQSLNPKDLRKEGRNLFLAGPNAALRAVGQPARQPAAVTPAAAGANPPGTAEPRNALGNPARAPKIHQGSLEASNVNPVQEMTRLIEAQRLFEQNTRLMQSVGEMSSRVNEVGRY